MLGKCVSAQGSSDDVSIHYPKNLPQIYTDWANYYLERAKSKRRVADLSADCRDGLLLAEVIEAVTSFKVPDIVKKPKTQQQMHDNVKACLTTLRLNCVGGLDAITATDIQSGRLKAVLSLFFALSRYKQATKQKVSNTGVLAKQQQQQQPQQQQQHQQQVAPPPPMTNRQLPLSYAKAGPNGGTAIPLPATVLVTRRCPPDKVRPLPPTPGQQASATTLSKQSGAIAGDGGSQQSTASNSPLHKGNNSLRHSQPMVKAPPSPYSSQNSIPNGSITGSLPTEGGQKQSMLHKFKLFNREKSDRTKQQTSKRTSSSSGFSSARSERSDSSLSLNDGQYQCNKVTGPGGKKGDQKSQKVGSTKQPAVAKANNANSVKTKGEKGTSVAGRKESDTHIPAAPKVQKSTAPLKAESVTSVGKSKHAMQKIEVRSESRNSLSSISKSSVSVNANTGIPKPMAAIKGTTKPPASAAKAEDAEVQSKLDISPAPVNINKHHQANAYISASSEVDHKTQVVNPLECEKVPIQPSAMPANQHPPSIAMTDSTHSSSTHSTSTGLHSNSSESSVIYRPSSESGSDIFHSRASFIQSPLRTVIPNRKVDKLPPHPAYRGASEPLRGDQKFHTVPSKQSLGEEEKPVAVVPMRPLLRGYNSHVTLPTRGSRSHRQFIVQGLTEELTNQGYCSDSDGLKSLSSKYMEIDNGYLSEGGSPGKHLMSVIRQRQMLPTTIEERSRCGRHENAENLEGNLEMEMNGTSTGSKGLRNGRENWNKIPEPNNGICNEAQLSPTASRKEKCSPSHSRRSHSSSKGGSSRTKVPQSFGYIKRTNGAVMANNIVQDGHQQMLMGQQGVNRTAHVSAVPRTGKIKVSGGTQTCSTDLQSKVHPNSQHRSFSLTGPGAAQLSQSIRERLSTGSHSLPKPGTDLQFFHHRMSNRASAKLNDGSLSDTQTYAEVKPDYGTYAMWLKHSNTAVSRLSEGDSLESLQINQMAGVRNHKLQLQRDPFANSSRLNRSNSIRSTKSEKMYPSLLSRGVDMEIEPYYCLPVGTQMQLASGSVPWSQPTSPTPPNRSFTGPLSPTHNIGQRLPYQKKNDEVHGSAASLLSGGSSLYGTGSDDRQGQVHEVRRLKRELLEAREQVMSLSSQLSTNAHVVSAFEQSLSNMTQRFNQLSASAERKDSELTDLRQTIELLRKQSIQAGLTSAHMQSMGVQANCQPVKSEKSISSTTSTGTDMQRHHSSDSMCSLNSISSGCSTQDKKKKKGWLRSSFTKAFSRNAKISKTNRQVNNNVPAAVAEMGLPPPSPNTSVQEKVSSTPPSPIKSPVKQPVTVIENAKPIDAIVEFDGSHIVEDLKKQLREKDLVLTDIRLEALSSASQLESLKDTVMKMRAEMINLKQNNERLQKLVTSRSLAGSSGSLGAPLSPNGSLSEPRRYSLVDNVSRPPMELPNSFEETEEENIPPAPAPDPPQSMSPTSHIDLTPPPQVESVPPEALNTGAVVDDIDHLDGKKISIAVYLGQPDSFQKYSEEIMDCDYYYANLPPTDSLSANGGENGDNANFNEFTIAFTYISGKTTWQNLDYIVRKTFKDYLSKIDPGTSLGLNTDSITSYHLGEAKRGPEMGFPELLPCGYIIGNVRTLYICLQGVGSLAFDSLIPRSIVHRYISLLTEHRRLILCGPSGTGKSYLARKLAEFLVARSGRGNPTEAIATFNVDHKSSKELQQYLVHVAEQASMVNCVSELPSVIILDNLHHASALGDVFSCLLSAGPASKLPCIIGTMSQATCNTTNLQLHHNFRWVLTANHMEPVKGFLARFLRRKLFVMELTSHAPQSQLSSVLAWLPTVWQHINRFLETHNSSDVTIGPRLFLTCPLDMNDSQVWFTDVWNYHLAPYLVNAVREGVQLYGRRGGVWVDPSTYIRDTYPWPVGPTTVPSLRQINAEDVGLEAGPTGSSEQQDPLLNMLMRLQEAANYTNNQDQESDCASLDSNITQDSFAGGD
ncbi:protein sickie isoform X4 [Lutzomyia longipalpis]|uniref:protein sickie isoform X4 n=1 Tax=Lutzomyia longipalpis TaxID=7200 RepID=UPI0024846873|nr:protein sickie isoform X4 [Lutzomyia longipalpis]